MSSVSMALNGKQIPLPTSTGYVDANPGTSFVLCTFVVLTLVGTLNAWLRDNNGYDSENDLEGNYANISVLVSDIDEEDALPKIDPSAVVWVGKYNSSVSEAEIQSWITKGRVVIANVHFSLISNCFVAYTQFDLGNEWAPLCSCYGLEYN